MYVYEYFLLSFPVQFYVMEDIPRKLLCSLIKQQGNSIIQDPTRFRNLLNDFFHSEYRRERKCLSDSLSEDIPGILLTKRDQLSYSTLSQQLCQKLINNLGITPELARWTVDSWAAALEIVRAEDLQPSDYFLFIISNPPGARIILNGIFIGLTPLNVKNPEIKTHQLSITYEGYQPWTQSLSLDGRTNSTITANLTKKAPQSGSIFIETYPSNAEIYLNSKKYGRTPKEIENLAEGYYEVRLATPGYKDIVIHKHVQAGRTTRITESFVPDPVISPTPRVTPKAHSRTLLEWAILLIPLFIIGFLGYYFISNIGIPSTEPSVLPANGSFIQSPLSAPQQYSKTSGDWQFTLTSTNAYTLSGEVVGRQEYPATMPNGIIPLDLAVVNGDLISQDILSYFKFTMGSSALTYSYDIPISTGLTEKYIDEHISLNRLVFLNPELEREVKKAQVGSCVIINGKLVDIRGSSQSSQFSITTSTVRNDSYPGGAEIILVESFTPVSCGESTG